MDHTGALRGFGAAHEGPGAHLVGSCGEECLEVEQRVCSAYQSCHTRLLKSYLGEEFLALLVGVELGDVGLGLCGHNEQLGILALYGLAHGIHILVAVDSRAVVNVADIKHRF